MIPKNKHISPRETAETLGAAKLTIRYILKNKTRHGKLSNTKMPGRTQKPEVDNHRVLSLVKKNLSLRENASLLTIKRCVHERNYRGVTVRYRPLVTLRLDFASLSSSGTRFLFLTDD